MPKWNYILDVEEFDILNFYIVNHHPHCVTRDAMAAPDPLSVNCSCGFDEARALIRQIREVVKPSGTR